MNRFYIGQKVVYITGVSFPAGSIHVIKDIIVFSCGCLCLDVGAMNERGLLSCDKHHTNNGEISHRQHFHASSFRPLSERSAESESFSETLIKELETEINEENLILK